MSMIDVLVEQVKKNSWLSISTIFFDNSYSIEPIHYNGRICYSPSKELFFTMGTSDSCDSDVVFHKAGVLASHTNVGIMGMQQTISCVGTDHMQHFDLSMFTTAHMYKDGEDFPIIKWPSSAEMSAAAEANAEDSSATKLSDTILMKSGNSVEALPLYSIEGADWYSGIRVDFYKTYADNHAKFISAINTMYSISDCI